MGCEGEESGLQEQEIERYLEVDKDAGQGHEEDQRGCGSNEESRWKVDVER